MPSHFKFFTVPKQGLNFNSIKSSNLPKVLLCTWQMKLQAHTKPCLNQQIVGGRKVVNKIGNREDLPGSVSYA